METRSRRLGLQHGNELYSCRRDKHVVAFCRTKICLSRNASDWDADVVEVVGTVLTDTANLNPMIDVIFQNLDTPTNTISNLQKVERVHNRKSRGSVATCLRRDGKYDKNLSVNLLKSPIVIEFLKLVNICQSYP